MSAAKRDQIENFIKNYFISKIDVNLIIWSRIFIISKKIFFTIFYYMVVWCRNKLSTNKYSYVASILIIFWENFLKFLPIIILNECKSLHIKLIIFLAITCLATVEKVFLSNMKWFFAVFYQKNICNALRLKLLFYNHT